MAEAEAQALFALENAPDRPVLVTSSAEWHPGVVGLISARTKERFRRPAFAFTLNPDGTATGSGRSVPGVDLGVRRARGGRGRARHQGRRPYHGGGVTIRAADLELFQAFVTERLSGAGERHAIRDHFAVDATLTAAGAQPAW